jgi:hypothetical protein
MTFGNSVTIFRIQPSSLKTMRSLSQTCWVLYAQNRASSR